MQHLDVGLNSICDTNANKISKSFLPEAVLNLQLKIYLKFIRPIGLTSKSYFKQDSFRPATSKNIYCLYDSKFGKKLNKCIGPGSFSVQRNRTSGHN